jgi:hypothetical protein
MYIYLMHMRLEASEKRDSSSFARKWTFVWMYTDNQLNMTYIRFTRLSLDIQLHKLVSIPKHNSNLLDSIYRDLLSSRKAWEMFHLFHSTSHRHTVQG